MPPPTRSRRGRATGRTRPPTTSTPSNCGRTTISDRRPRAQSTDRPGPTASDARRPAGASREGGRGRRVSVRGGRPLRRQIEAALSGEADPLGEDGLGLPDRARPDERRSRDEFAVAGGAGRADPARETRQRSAAWTPRSAWPIRPPGRKRRRAGRDAASAVSAGSGAATNSRRCRTCTSCRRSCTPAGPSPRCGRGSGRRTRHCP